MTRARLPDRRPARTVETEWNGHAITLTLGFDPATGALREVFANAARGAMHATIADACVWASIALQHGVPLAALGRSTLRAPDAFGQDQPASPLGAILDALLAETGGRA